MKASEHFDLPLCVGDHPSALERVYESSEQEHCAEFNTPEQAAIAAKCINHADKLAEALVDLIEQSTNYAANFKSEYYAAIDALEAYRSEK